MTKFIFAMVGLVFFAMTTTAQAGLGGVRWELSELNGKRFTNSRVYIEFNETEKRITGHTGCNRMFGSYELIEGAFKLSGAGATKMACMRPGTMETEAAFLKALNDATQVKKSGRNLTFLAGDTRVLRLKAAAQTKPVTGDLTSNRWMLKAIGGTAVNLSKDAPFLNFDAGKKSAGGNSGCNVFGGNYETEGSTIKFSQMISTMRACEFEDRMTIERGFLDGLQNADRFEIKDRRLFIYKSSEILLEFEGVAK